MMGAKETQDLSALNAISPCAFSAYSVSKQGKFCVINVLNKNVLYNMFFAIIECTS
jgi:hypothetical protein